MVKIKTPKKAIIEFFNSNYEEEITALSEKDGFGSLKVNFTDLMAFLGESLPSLTDGSKILELLTLTLKELSKKDDVGIQINSLPETTPLKLLGAEDVGKLISTTAMVKRISDIIPRISIAKFECRSCMLIHQVEQNSSFITKPALCVECGGKSFKLLKRESKYINTQLMLLEEPLELRTDGSTREFKATLEGGIITPGKSLNPGDVVNIVGLLDVDADKKQERMEFIIRLNNIEELKRSFEDVTVTKEEISEIKTLSKTENIIETLKNSILPNIHGYNALKDGLLVQLFCGSEQSDFGRPNIHILIVGDPGLAKSEILKSIVSLSPKGYYVNGAEATKAGILGAAVEDKLMGGWTIDAGAIAMADNGLLCIDEMDKMYENVILSLNEPMEQQTVTETKAGLNATMNARTPLLVAANPKTGRYDKYRDLITQINVPDSTLSRFDLIYALEDSINRKKDIELAEKILGKNEDANQIIEPELLRKYIAYAKNECNPSITEEAKQSLINFYVDLRESTKMTEDSKIITVRDLQALRRIAISLSRIRLKNSINLAEAEMAIQIYKNSLESLGFDVNPSIEKLQISTTHLSSIRQE